MRRNTKKLTGILILFFFYIILSLFSIFDESGLQTASNTVMHEESASDTNVLQSDRSDVCPDTSIWMENGIKIFSIQNLRSNTIKLNLSVYVFFYCPLLFLCLFFKKVYGTYLAENLYPLAQFMCGLITRLKKDGKKRVLTF